jgi:hypothetical protein
MEFPRTTDNGKLACQNQCTVFFNIVVFWLMTTCPLVRDYQHFGGNTGSISSETLVTIYQTTRYHNPEDTVVIFTAVKTSFFIPQAPTIYLLVLFGA